MKRAILLMLALSLTLAVPALAQDDAPVKGDKAFKTLDANGDGKVTKDEFMAAAQKRAAARWEKLDPTGKGFVTKEDLEGVRAKAREKAQARKAKKDAPAQ
ncbi:hypothetical protein NNJEOMEG_02481 [Fundidesulfovibrio magnetotacticus]|uniref:EF-hand domain-containing protein n=1 Tax=Fundidesulfovibrio magnetotacticus TaxID=2730080 RepID=A0A6V8LSB6_9BACT|nr:EF-hand domain-containing protein [Fundidesulfovibrio magnetotacticus]GFK94634.1 hypothetical protein NNJEOMEG_02481 [Fundidesulfovibrio magnetotacticus]